MSGVSGSRHKTEDSGQPYASAALPPSAHCVDLRAGLDVSNRTHISCRCATFRPIGCLSPTLGLIGKTTRSVRAATFEGAFLIKYYCGDQISTCKMADCSMHSTVEVHVNCKGKKRPGNVGTSGRTLKSRVLKCEV
jgi:hypothetical protein